MALQKPVVTQGLDITSALKRQLTSVDLTSQRKTWEVCLPNLTPLTGSLTIPSPPPCPRRVMFCPESNSFNQSQQVNASHLGFILKPHLKFLLVRRTPMLSKVTLVGSRKDV